MLWTHHCGEEDPILYPSLIDPDSTSRNFSTIGKHADLYFTQFHFAYGNGTCWTSLDRDLIKIPVQFDEPPDCSAVMAVPDVLPSPTRRLFPVKVTGAPDPDGGPVTTSITAVTQNEPLRGPGDRTTPDAVRLSTDRVLLRAERNLKGTGRVYRLSVTATDSTGNSCSTTETVSIPRGAPDSEPRYDSFG
jgi:hypothetical protein